VARVDVIMPQMGESIAEGTVSLWWKKVGDEVNRDEQNFEISTYYEESQFTAPSAVVLSEIVV
jgi:pyruvate dehydrogenase E2 component (dihydrolipoamide acetyltransferase)